MTKQSSNDNEPSLFPLNAQGKPIIPNSPVVGKAIFFSQEMPFIETHGFDPVNLAEGQPALSLVVTVYKMRKQALRTLESLSARYQQGVTEQDYEVIVVENESSETLTEAEVRQFGENFKYFLRKETLPTPVPAANFGARQATGAMIGLIIDGARMATPGLVSWTIIGRKLHRDAIIATPGYHLGEKLQQEAILGGYDEAQEDKLLEKIKWPQDGYRLFEISVLSGTSATGVFKPISESNCISMPRHIWEKLGGCDERFTETGGGQVNLDLYKRACELPETKLVMLLGEGTFHQLHGGITTGTRGNERQAIMAAHFAQYASIRGEPYTPPLKRCIFLGAVPDCAQKFLHKSAERVRQLRGEIPDPLNKKAMAIKNSQKDSAS